MRPTDISKTIRNRVGNSPASFSNSSWGVERKLLDRLPEGLMLLENHWLKRLADTGPSPKTSSIIWKANTQIYPTIRKTKQKTDSVEQRLNVRLAFRMISINQYGGLSFWMTWQLAFLYLITANHQHSLHASFFHILISLLLTQSNI